LKLEILIPNYYFEFSELIFQFRIFLIESKNGDFSFQSENWHFNSEFFKFQLKDLFHPENDIWILNFLLESKINI